MLSTAVSEAKACGAAVAHCLRAVPQGRHAAAATYRVAAEALLNQRRSASSGVPQMDRQRALGIIAEIRSDREPSVRAVEVRDKVLYSEWLLDNGKLDKAWVIFGDAMRTGSLPKWSRLDQDVSRLFEKFQLALSDKNVFKVVSPPASTPEKFTKVGI